MATTLALRALLATTLGLGVADLAWLDLALAPDAYGDAPALVPPTRAPAVRPSILDAPPREVASAVHVAPAPIARVEAVFFERMSSTLAPAGRDALATIARLATHDIVVVGHSDHRGDPDINRTLRLRRAMAVRAHLALLGVSSDRVHVRAADDSAPADDAELWRQRRAEILFTTGVAP